MNKKIMNRNIMHKLSQNSNLIFCACISFRTSTLNVCHMMILLHRHILAKKDYSFSNNVVGLSCFFLKKKKVWSSQNFICIWELRKRIWRQKYKHRNFWRFLTDLVICHMKPFVLRVLTTLLKWKALLAACKTCAHPMS